MTALLWTFPLILVASIALGWAAEIAAVYLSAGVALAVLAWLQTAPEFAVEADIAWSRQTSLALANLTGSLRLLLGLGWPLVYFVYAFSKSRRGIISTAIKLPENFSVESAGLLLPVLYFGIVRISGRWTSADGLILIGLYILYLYLLNLQRKRLPHMRQENEETKFTRKVLSLPAVAQIGIVLATAILSGIILVKTVHPFLKALQTAAMSFGISQFVFIQWVAPIASELPEKVTALRWARRERFVPYALVNIISSVISQWTLLVGLIPLIFSLSAGHWFVIEFTDFQKTEISLTLAQSLLAVLFLADLKITFIESLALLALWLVQLLRPEMRSTMIYIYLSWSVIEATRLILNPRQILAWKTLKEKILQW